MKAVFGVGLLVAMISAPALAIDGPALYQQHCAKCHGDTGQADSWRGYMYFSRDFSSMRWQAANTDEDILADIDRGPRIMPAYKNKLSEAERNALVQVVRSFGLARLFTCLWLRNGLGYH